MHVSVHVFNYFEGFVVAIFEAEERDLVENIPCKREFWHLLVRVCQLPSLLLFII